MNKMLNQIIPIKEQKIFKGVHIEMDTDSQYATEKDMNYIVWALRSISFAIENHISTGGFLSGGTKWWLERDE